VAPTPAPSATRPTVGQRPSARPKPRPRAHAKPKKRIRTKAERQHEPIVKKVKAPKSVAHVDLAGATTTKTESVNTVVVSVMGFAILCFAIAAVPWAVVPRRAAYHVVPRQPNLTLLGLILLVAAAFTVLFTRGP
jgi:hypothetical protein